MSKAFSNKHKKESKQKRAGAFRLPRKETPVVNKEEPFTYKHTAQTSRQSPDVNTSLRILLDELHTFEESYGMSTLEFYAQFKAGQMGDSRDFFKWAGAFELYQHLLQIYFQPQSKVA